MSVPIDEISSKAICLILTDTTRRALESAEERKVEAEERLASAQAIDEAAIRGIAAAIPATVGRYRKALDGLENALSARMERSRELLRSTRGNHPRAQSARAGSQDAAGLAQQPEPWAKP
ncbi:MAG: hypothetical protein KGN34_10515 [Sphingomonadales bacterium]|nr:hypothetical protein [Sphingomonadales bacterium]